MQGQILRSGRGRDDTRGRVLLLSWSVDTVRVSVEDPDELVAALTA